MAKYLALIYGDQRTWAAASPEWRERNAQRHEAFLASAGAAIVGGQELEPAENAVSVRTDRTGEPVATDGPFAEAKEVVGGYYLIDAPDLERAIELAKLVPEVADASSGVELRRIVEPG